MNFHLLLLERLFQSVIPSSSFLCRGRFRCVQVNHADIKSLSWCIRRFRPQHMHLFWQSACKKIWWKFPKMKERKVSKCDVSAADRRSRLLWRSNERFLWEAMSAGEWRWSLPAPSSSLLLPTCHLLSYHSSPLCLSHFLRDEKKACLCLHSQSYYRLLWWSEAFVYVWHTVINKCQSSYLIHVQWLY